MIQWRLEEIARNKRRRNRRAKVRYARISIEGKWWNWSEDRESWLIEVGQNGRIKKE